MSQFANFLIQFFCSLFLLINYFYQWVIFPSLWAILLHFYWTPGVYLLGVLEHGDNFKTQFYPLWLRKKEGRKKGVKGEKKGRERGREGISLYLIFNHKTILPPQLAFVLISCVFSVVTSSCWTSELCICAVYFWLQNSARFSLWKSVSTTLQDSGCHSKLSF